MWDRSKESTIASYPNGYGAKPLPVAEQVRVFKTSFPKLFKTSSSDLKKLEKRQLLAGAEGTFVIPDWRVLGETKDIALLRILRVIKNRRRGNFLNFLESYIRDGRVQQSDRFFTFMGEIAKRQPGNDLFAVQGQFGLRFRNESPQNTLYHIGRLRYEFPASLFALACMVLTNPSRFMSTADLDVDSPDDEIVDMYSIDVRVCPVFSYSQDNSGRGLRLSHRLWRGAYPFMGSASLFLTP